MKKILVAILCAIFIIAGIVAIQNMINYKKRLQSNYILAQLKYNMAMEEVINIVGNRGLTRFGSGKYMYGLKLPDGRRVGFVGYFLGKINVEETKGDLAGCCFEYDLDKQELIMPFMPDSLMGIQYGMTEEEIEKIFIGDSQQNVSYYGGGRSSQIALSSTSYEYAEPKMCIDVNLIRLSTGEWVNLGFESLHNEPSVLLYVYMKAADRKWYVYDLNTQELTKERAPKDKILEGHEWN